MSLIQFIIYKNKERYKMKGHTGSIYLFTKFHFVMSLLILLVTLLLNQFSNNYYVFCLIIFNLSMIVTIYDTPKDYFFNRIITYPRLVVRTMLGIPGILFLGLFALIPTFLIIIFPLNPMLDSLNIPKIIDQIHFLYVLITLIYFFNFFMMFIHNQTIKKN
jgi:hypothetical protein